MTKRNIVLGLATVALCALAAYAQTPSSTPGMWHHHPHKMGGGPGRLIPLLLHSTDLTPEQETQAHRILSADRPAVQQIVSQLHQAKKDLTSLMLAPQVQQDSVTAQQAVIAQLQQQLAQHQLSTVMAIRALLTPDQLAKANAAKDQWHGRHGDGAACNKKAS